MENGRRLRKMAIAMLMLVVAIGGINAGHGFVPVGGKIKPTRAEITKMVADFFDEHLKQLDGTQEDLLGQPSLFGTTWNAAIEQKTIGPTYEAPKSAFHTAP